MPRPIRSLLTAAALAALLMGCATGQKTARDTTASSTPTTDTVFEEAFPEEGIPTTTKPEVREFKVGEAGTFVSVDTNQDVLRVAVTKVQAITGEEYNQPERAYFLGVYVKVKALADDQSSLWGDFYVTMRGHHYDGDAYADRFQPTLDYVDLNEGETSEGWLVFDVPARHGEVVLGQSYEGGKVATWSF